MADHRDQPAMERDVVRLYCFLRTRLRLPLYWNTRVATPPPGTLTVSFNANNDWSDQDLRVMAFLNAQQIFYSEFGGSSHTVEIAPGTMLYNSEVDENSEEGVTMPSREDRLAFVLPIGHQQYTKLRLYTEFYAKQARNYHKQPSSEARQLAIATSVHKFNGTVTEETTCQVCLCTFVSEQCQDASTIVHTNCKCLPHSQVYGRQCITEWLKVEDTCPICRKLVVQIHTDLSAEAKQLLDLYYGDNDEDGEDNVGLNNFVGQLRQRATVPSLQGSMVGEGVSTTADSGTVSLSVEIIDTAEDEFILGLDEDAESSDEEDDDDVSDRRNILTRLLGPGYSAETSTPLVEILLAEEQISRLYTYITTDDEGPLLRNISNGFRDAQSQLDLFLDESLTDVPLMATCNLHRFGDEINSLVDIVTTRGTADQSLELAGLSILGRTTSFLLQALRAKTHRLLLARTQQSETNNPSPDSDSIPTLENNSTTSDPPSSETETTTIPPQIHMSRDSTRYISSQDRISTLLQLRMSSQYNNIIVTCLRSQENRIPDFFYSEFRDLTNIILLINTRSLAIAENGNLQRAGFFLHILIQGIEKTLEFMNEDVFGELQDRKTRRAVMSVKISLQCMVDFCHANIGITGYVITDGTECYMERARLWREFWVRWRGLEPYPIPRVIWAGHNGAMEGLAAEFQGMMVIGREQRIVDAEMAVAGPAPEVVVSEAAVVGPEQAEMGLDGDKVNLQRFAYLVLRMRRVVSQSYPVEELVGE